MKRILCIVLALLLILTAIPALSACSNKRAADYVKGDEIVIDNETPYIYDPEQNVIVKFADQDGNPWEYGVDDYGEACCYRSDDKTYTYDSVIKYYGNKPIRMLETEKETLYYTVYSLDDNTLCYIYFEKEGNSYILTDCFQADVRDDVLMTDMTYPHDLPSAILGDKLPEDCYLKNYTPEEIAENVERKWAYYYSQCNAVNLPHSIYTDKDHVSSHPFIRCIQSVSFDIVRNDKGFHGVYVYDIYVHDDGSGVLYFYHLDDQNYLPSYTYTLIQEETVSLTAEEVASVVDVMVEWDFANYPTWTPEERLGFDGSNTYIYGTGKFGEAYCDHLIAMWEPTPRYPHHHIRTAIENLVRAHITVEEGRIYRKDLYEEYNWMQ